jgi:hypothetical protein
MTAPIEVGTTGNPMSTVPKDGRFVRVLVERFGWCRVRWDLELHCWAGQGFRLLDRDTVIGWQTDPDPLTT